MAEWRLTLTQGMPAPGATQWRLEERTEWPYGVWHPVRAGQVSRQDEEGVELVLGLEAAAAAVEELYGLTMPLL